MSATPAHPTPAHDDTAAQQREADTAYYREVLHELIEIGTTLARTLPHQATQQPTPEPTTPEAAAAQPQPAPATALDLATAYERLTRAIRRTILLARTLDQPAPLLVARGPAPRKPAPSCDLARMTDAELDALPDDVDPLAPETRLAAHAHITRAVEDAIRHEAREPSEAALLRAELAERLDDPGLDYDIADRPIEEVIAAICRDLGLSDIGDLRARATCAAQPPPEEASSTAQPTAAPPQAAPPRAQPTQTSTGPPAS